jgi:hypothetical protein
VAGRARSNRAGIAGASGRQPDEDGLLRIQPLSAKLHVMSDQFEGSCLCGAVRFVATGQPESVAWCHCESCRKHSGAPVSVFVAFKRDAYVVTDGQITKFNFVAREVAGILCQMRVDVDLRRRTLERNAFSCRRIS